MVLLFIGRLMEEHNKSFYQLLSTPRNETGQSKSMLTEECHLNEYLKKWCRGN
jgi:hypothetical protein